MFIATFLGQLARSVGLPFLVYGAVFDKEVFQTRSADLYNLKLIICEEKRMVLSPVVSVEFNEL
jgi:hypothetical protein